VTNSPMIVFCTTSKNRTFHLEKTLPKNLADNASYPNLKFVILDYGDPNGLAVYLKSKHVMSMTTGRVAVYNYMTSGPFRMAHAKNLAHRAGILEGADILVNLDADNFTGPGFAEWLAEQFQKPNIFCSPGVIKGKGKKLRGCGGRIAVTPTAFINAGGYDEKYDTWASDDKDFVGRLLRMGYQGNEIDLRFLESIPHGDGIRFKEYPHIRETAGSDELEIDASTATIANYGQFGCGILVRNYFPLPIPLVPLPTRIFGIGLHKTATNSLNTALGLLDYDSVHWRSPKKARAIWREMRKAGRSWTLEQHYATCDLPIPLLYRELDKAYPGSKFILTVRSDGKWLASVQNHWSRELNPWRSTWDTDCFTHEIHRELYGRTEFDGAVFLDRYRRHNAEVKAYFTSRADDLLVLDVDRGHGWPELCGFLGKPIPAVPYPKEYATS
jgi:Sulfotransferase domain/N-terminal domain of galactosyltransferase